MIICTTRSRRKKPNWGEAVRLIGATHFLFATDYPHDDPGGRMKYKDVELLKRRSDISADDKALIWSGNAIRLLGGSQ